MHRFYFQRLGLCEEAGETSPAPSGGVETPPEGTPPAVSENKPANKVGVIQALKTQLQGAVATAAQIQELESRVTALTTERDGLQAKLTLAGTDLAALRTENAKLKSEAQEVEDTLAGIGIPSAQLPAQAPAGAAPAETIEELQAKLGTMSDPQAKGEIVSQIKALRKKEEEKKGA